MIGCTKTNVLQLAPYCPTEMRVARDRATVGRFAYCTYNLLIPKTHLAYSAHFAFLSAPFLLVSLSILTLYDQQQVLDLTSLTSASRRGKTPQPLQLKSKVAKTFVRITLLESLQLTMPWLRSADFI